MEDKAGEETTMAVTEANSGGRIMAVTVAIPGGTAAIMITIIKEMTTRKTTDNITNTLIRESLSPLLSAN
jgi:hypothetical protein